MTNSAKQGGSREPERIAIISLWMPWANWVMLGWKQIETRTHSRFQKLIGQRIGIHAAQKWDDGAIEAARPYLTAEQIGKTQSFLRIGGALIGTVFVEAHHELREADAARALIECSTKRYGLILRDPKIIEALPMRGKQGIWYRTTEAQ